MIPTMVPASDCGVAEAKGVEMRHPVSKAAARRARAKPCVVVPDLERARVSPLLIAIMSRFLLCHHHEAVCSSGRLGGHIRSDEQMIFSASDGIRRTAHVTTENDKWPVTIKQGLGDDVVQMHALCSRVQFKNVVQRSMNSSCPAPSDCECSVG